MIRFLQRVHASTKGLVQGWGELLLEMLPAGEVGQGKDGGTRADSSMPTAPSQYDCPGKFPIFREDYQSKRYLQGFLYTNDMEKLAKGRIEASYLDFLRSWLTAPVVSMGHLKI